ncbi:MAG: exporter of the superfamily protein-like protein [Planctomycetaceae bacterium]|nr:exporter of the superfamily protein-like protein [Planctomycetaceae bacterium]
MPHFFEKRDPWGNGLGLWVLVFMAFTLPVAAWGVSRLRMENDVEHWLSDDNIQTRQFTWYKQLFSSEDSLLLSWDGSSLEDPRVNRLATRLAGVPDADGIRRGGLKQVDAVRSPNQLIGRMVELKIDREEAIRRVTGVLAGPGRIWCNFSTTALNQKPKSIRALHDAAADRFGIKLTIVEPIIDIPDESEEETDNTAGESAGLNSAVAEAAPSETAAATPPLTEPVAEFEPAAQHDIELSWHNMHADSKQIQEFLEFAKSLTIPVVGENASEPLLAECYLHRGQPVALAIALSEAGQADRSETLALIRKAAVEVGIPADSLHLGGSPVCSAALNEEVMKALWNPDAPWYLPHERSVVIVSWLAGLGLAFWLLRSVRLAIIVLSVSYYTTLITVALVPAFGGSMNMVLIVMPTLLLVVTMSGAVHIANYWKAEAHGGGNQAIVQAIVTARLPCLMAAATTAIGLGSLLTSHLAPVRDFGFYSAVGTMLSVVAVLYAVPALLQAWPATPPPITVVMRRPWTRLGRGIVRHARTVTIAWLVLAAVSMYGLKYFRTETRVIRYFPDHSRLVQDYNHLEQNLAGIVPIETVISFGKTAREDTSFTQRMEIIRDIENKFRELPNISGTLSLADFQPVSEPLEANATGKKLLAHNARARAVESRVKKDPQVKSLFMVAKQDSEFSNVGDELWHITSQASIMSRLDYSDLTVEIDQACRAVMKYHTDTRHVVTGMVPLFLATQQAIIDSLIYSFVLAFVLIAIVMIIIARSVPAGLLSMIPNVLPVGMVFGAIAWYGIPVDVGTLITASVALGIAVDGTLHLLTWYRDSVIAGLSHRRAVVKSLEHCGPALWQTSAAIGLAMLVLAPANLLLISRFGWLMCSLIMTAMLADIVLTPAMLAGPMGWLIFRAALQHRNRLKTVSADPESGDPMRHEPHVTPPKPQIAEEPRDSRAHRFDEGQSDSRKRRR